VITKQHGINDTWEIRMKARNELIGSFYQDMNKFTIYYHTTKKQYVTEKIDTKTIDETLDEIEKHCKGVIKDRTFVTEIQENQGKWDRILEKHKKQDKVFQENTE